MTHNFASVRLARLYEKQGYIEDALDIYKAIDTSRHPEAKEILDTISRLEARKSTAGTVCKENADSSGPDVVMPGQVLTKEARMAHMLEIWLKLMIMQKRVDIFKNIKARL